MAKLYSAENCNWKNVKSAQWNLDLEKAIIWQWMLRALFYKIAEHYKE